LWAGAVDGLTDAPLAPQPVDAIMTGFLDGMFESELTTRGAPAVAAALIASGQAVVWVYLCWIDGRVKG
jgi:hypothetical protein